MFSDPGGHVLGFVRVIVGGQVFDLAVQSMALEKDGKASAGGFFANEGQLGILVDTSIGPSDVRPHIERATAEAVRHLSQRVLS